MYSVRFFPIEVRKANEKKKKKEYCNHIESILFKEVSRLLLSESPPKLRTYVISRRKIGRRGLRMKSVFI